MKESVDYHAAACVYIMAKWVLDDMPISEEEIADKIIKNRTVPQTDILGISADDYI